VPIAVLKLSADEVSVGSVSLRFVFFLNLRSRFGTHFGGFEVQSQIPLSAPQPDGQTNLLIKDYEISSHTYGTHCGIFRSFAMPLTLDKLLPIEDTQSRHSRHLRKHLSSDHRNHI